MLPAQINGKPLKCGLAVIVNLYNSGSQSGKSFNCLVQRETWCGFQSLYSTFDKQEGKHGYLCRANLYFCYHSFYFWPTIIHVTSKVLGKEWKKLINDVSLLYWLLFWVNLMLRQLAIVPLLKSCSQNLTPITMPLLFYDSETLIFICN